MSNYLTDFLIKMVMIQYLGISIKSRLCLHISGVVHGAGCFSDSAEVTAVTF